MVVKLDEGRNISINYSLSRDVSMTSSSLNVPFKVRINHLQTLTAHTDPEHSLYNVVLTYIDKQSFKLTFSPVGSLESLVNLRTCLWFVGGNWRTQGKPTQVQREHTDSTQKGSRLVD